MPNTVSMVHIDTGKTADVHPDEVENMKAADYRVVAEKPSQVPPLPPVPAPAAKRDTLSLKNKE